MAKRALRVGVAVLLAWAGPDAVAGSGEPSVFGRVRVSKVEAKAAGDSRTVEEALTQRFAAEPLAATRLISLRPRDEEPGRFVATVYDYASETAFDLLLDESGAELSRRRLSEQPPLGPEELADAMSIVSGSPIWAASVASGARGLYGPMPPISTDASGRRLVNVGLILRDASGEATENEIVSVHLPTGQVLRYDDGGPPTAVATSSVCGPAAVDCGAPMGSCAALHHYEWPASNPVWKLDVMHPRCTQSVQPAGTGLEIRNVYYRDRLILARAHMPVINVKYIGDRCGPYRDWLFYEGCFQAVGTAVAPGVLVTAGTAPATFCESGNDQGNFKGVAVHDEGRSLLLASELEAGHYRYVMQWRFHLDGTIEPVMAFGAASNSCTCFSHHHNGYWRFEFALDGTAADLSTGIATLDRRVPGTTADWAPISRETRFDRPAGSIAEDWLRIRNPQTGLAYVLKPGRNDGSASTLDYARGDTWALALNPNQIDDPNSSTAIAIDGWMNGEALGNTKRLVLWYRAGIFHDAANADHVCNFVGPKLTTEQSCVGTLGLDREQYGCSDTVSIDLADGDLAGRGSQAVVVRSGAEPHGETVLLAESPPGSGRFSGSVATTGAPATAGDGRVSVAHADTLTASYLDQSSCGVANVTIVRTAAVDCQPPRISGVAVQSVTETSATVVWTTDEPADSRARFGPTRPPATVVEDRLVHRTTHALRLDGLSPCADYYFSVASADRAGNLTTDTNGGSYYAFRTGGRGFALALDTVEGGTGAWQTAGSSGTRWHVSSCKSASPTRAWKAGSSSACPGQYGNYADTYLTSAPFGLGPRGHGFHLRFKELYETQAGRDLNRVQISVDGGATWSTLAEYSGSSGGWLQRDIDLSTFSGSNARIRFWLHTDNSIVSEGWYVDDVEISRPAACGPLLGLESHALQVTCPGVGGAALQPGATAAATIVVRNSGLGSATNVSATLATSTPGVRILRDKVALPDIAAGATGASLDPPFAFVVGPDVPCGTPIDFALTIASTQGSWTGSFAAAVGTGATGTFTYRATGLPKPIADYPGITTSSLAVPNGATVNDANVGLTLFHTYDADLDIFLIGPNGRRVELSTGNGGAGDNYIGTLFDDQATLSIRAGRPPFTGSFAPETPLAALNGISAAGEWTLEITDTGALDTGTLQEWFVTLTTAGMTCTRCATSAPPDPVPAVAWSPMRKTNLEWPTVASASWYHVHRGGPTDMPGLLDASEESCLRLQLLEPSTGDALTETPQAGSFFWYLVTAASAGGDGPAGDATRGPRILNSRGGCP